MKPSKEYLKSTEYQERKTKFASQVEDARIKRQQEIKERDEKRLAKTSFLSQLSSPSEKKETSDTVFKLLSDYLFSKVIFITLIFSEALNTNGTAITSTTNLIGTSRITDTSEGKYLNIDKESRMRCSFYLENADQLQGYILSPAIYDSFSSLNSFTSLNILRAYVGLKFYQGVVSVVVKQADSSEMTFDTNFRFSGTGSSDTYELEIKYNITYTDIYINDNLVGSYSSDFIGRNQTIKTYLPLLSPAKSLNGSAVGIVIENYQFIQSK